jgi:peroxiredoxin
VIREPDSQSSHGPVPESRGRPWSGLLRSVLLPAGILALILGGLWYWDSRDAPGKTNDARYGVVELPAGKNATGEDPRADVGYAGPDFVLQGPGGGEVRLSDFQGGPVLLNFWATWCPPCRTEMPELVRAHQEYAPDGLTVLAVNLQEPDGAVLEFAEEFGVDFPLAVDREGELSEAWRLGGPIEGIPSSYFIDADGIIRDVFYGPMDSADIAEGVDAVRAAGPS